MTSTDPSGEPSTTTYEAAKLAHLAREALAQGWDCTLLVSQACSEQSEAPVTLQDHEGQPVFTCAGSSPVVAMAGQAALLRFAVPQQPEVHVVLGGRLRLLGGRRRCCRHGAVQQVALELEQVVVQERRGGGAASVGRQVPLTAYHQATRGVLQRYAVAVVEHTNARHQLQLRQCVAQHLGCPIKRIAGVQLVDIDAAGVDLVWIDSDGAHRQRWDFDTHAASPAMLRRMLHEHLG